MSVRFTRECDTKFVHPQGITVGRIRHCLNSTLFALNCGAYFLVASAKKWGELLLTLAMPNVADIVRYDLARLEALETLGLNEFTFAQDTAKVKVFVGQAPLAGSSGGWQPSESEGRVAYEHMAVGIENSNPTGTSGKKGFALEG